MQHLKFQLARPRRAVPQRQLGFLFKDVTDKNHLAPFYGPCCTFCECTESTEAYYTKNNITKTADFTKTVKITEPSYSTNYYIQIICATTNTFCRTWYLLHSQVHNDQIVPIKMWRQYRVPRPEFRGEVEVLPIWPKIRVILQNFSPCTRKMATFPLPV